MCLEWLSTTPQDGAVVVPSRRAGEGAAMGPLECGDEGVCCVQKRRAGDKAMTLCRNWPSGEEWRRGTSRACWRGRRQKNLHANTGVLGESMLEMVEGVREVLWVPIDGESIGMPIYYAVRNCTTGASR